MHGRIFEFCRRDNNSSKKGKGAIAMSHLSPKTRKRLEIQGFVNIDEEVLAPTAPWLRFAFGLCTLLAALGTLLASPKILLSLAPIAALGAIFTVHPFDLVYNFGIRIFTGTGELPRRGNPNRFACGLASVWLVATALLFLTGKTAAGYVLGGTLVGVALLVSTVDICIPSMIYRALFGWSDRDKPASS
jgi:hypothetical protein